MSPKVPSLRIPVPKQGGQAKAPAVPGLVEGESAGRGILRDRRGDMHTTPSRPIPASIRGPRVLCKAVTKRWGKKYRDSSSVFQDAGSRFKGQRKSKRVSWGEWVPPASRGSRTSAPNASEVADSAVRALTGDSVGSGGVDADFGSTYPAILGDECMSAAPSPSPRAPDVQPRISRHKGSSGSGLPTLLSRVAQLSRPQCWIGDTGCGYDLMV